MRILLVGFVKRVLLVFIMGFCWFRHEGLVDFVLRNLLFFVMGFCWFCH